VPHFIQGTSSPGPGPESGYFASFRGSNDLLIIYQHS
jgi:hypothetical protein